MSIFDVAKAAGVSTATVSRVLNEFPGVRSETVRLVREAVVALNYTPQRNRKSRKGDAGKGRAAARTGTIAVITLGQTRDWLQLPIMASVVAGIQRAAGEFGFRLLLDDVPDPLKHSLLTKKWEIDGAIVFLTGAMPVGSYETILAGMRQQVPVVWVMGAEMTAVGVDHVSPDNISTGYLAHRYLHSKGCKELGFVTTDPAWIFLRLRGQSFLNAAYDAGHPATAYLVGSPGMLADSFGRRVVTARTLEELVVQIAKAKPRPTGLFIANDRTTAAVYPLLAKHDIEVGHDLTIVSCDNEQIRLTALTPQPASIDIGAEEIGFRAVVRLQARMLRRNDPPLLIQTAPHLVLPPTAESDASSA